uniref:Transposase n=1 Tax=Nostoc flagelliforme str. Sunitezuoqi TaxID=676037 RepID=E7DPM6_9NOSO|nr:transposase [Nostoc flagelliforme str. Sunitezuoqi]
MVLAKFAPATGLSPKTIRVGIRELNIEASICLKHTRFQKRIRTIGGGRKRLQDIDPTLIPDLEALIDPVTRGHPESPLCWTSKSTTKLAAQMRVKGHVISARKVASLLYQLGYSLQSNRKTKEGDSHPDRDAQFQYIHDQVQDFQQRCQPVISVDTKKKELIGEYKNNGQEWQPKKQPIDVKSHDFPDEEMGKVVPYGIYDLAANQGCVNVGINHDTAEFAVESIRRWWLSMGNVGYSNAAELLITADCGGSNGYRLRLWKTQLQKLANEFGLVVQVAHFPPGTSKWNKIEHRMFCHITENWRGKPLTSREVVINLIGNTTTNKGLTIKARLDENKYQKGIKISDRELSSVQLEKSEFHGDWNYRIIPEKDLNLSSSSANR